MVPARRELHVEPRPTVVIVDALDESAARTIAAVKQCGAEAVRLRPPQDYEALIRDRRPALIVVDVDYPTPRLGILLVDLAMRLARPSVIVMGESLASVVAARASAWPRCTWLQRPVHEGQLLTAIRAALIRPRRHLTGAVADLGGIDRRRLRPRERQIADLLLEHYRVPAVAEKLSISTHTVRSHLKTIFRRWGVSSQQELLRALRESGAMTAAEGELTPPSDHGAVAASREKRPRATTGARAKAGS